MGCSGSNMSDTKIQSIIDRSNQEILEANQRIDQYETQIIDYERQIDDLTSNEKGDDYYRDDYHRDDYVRENSYNRSRESGVDLSEDDNKDTVDLQKQPDYVKIKIKGFQDEIEKLKAAQVVEQQNINEIQSKINQISMEKNKRKTNKLKSDLTRHEKYLSPTKI